MEQHSADTEKENDLLIVARREQDGLGVIISPAATTEEIEALINCLVEHLKKNSDEKTLH